MQASPLTIEECVERACARYPEMASYGLLDQLNDVSLSDISRSWLPRITATAQATVQNAVPQYPAPLARMLEQQGISAPGLSKFQYKAGVDVNQTLWDGGNSRARRRVSEAQTAVEQARLDVELYALRGRVERLYFAILLSEAQTDIVRRQKEVVDAQLKKLRSMLAAGTAMQADVDAVEAESLTIRQTITAGQATTDGLRRMLAIYIGEEPGELVTPDAPEPSELSPDGRRELLLLSRREAAVSAGERLTDVALMPRVGLFGQASFGYPGLDYFKSMLDRTPQLSLLAGVRVTWQIDAFYTRSLSARKARIERRRLAVDKEVFLLNTSLQAVSQRADIAAARRVMADDARIVELRAAVRRAAESRLENGVIDVTVLLSRISDENVARLTAKLHEIQLSQAIYNLKYTLAQ